MKQTLQLKTSQHLALTPQLQQSIRLLQLSTLELHQEIEQVLGDNPLLERLDDPLDHSVRLLADGAINNAPSSQAEAPPRSQRGGERRAPAPDAEGGDRRRGDARRGAERIWGANGERQRRRRRGRGRPPAAGSEPRSRCANT
jgi:RNA polymerase sigma-54 factor